MGTPAWVLSIRGHGGKRPVTRVPPSMPPAGSPSPQPAADSASKQVVDEKYMADFNALNAAEEAAGQRAAVNINAKAARDAGAVTKKEEQLLEAVSLDEERQRGRKRKQPDDAQDQTEEQDPTELAAQKLGLAEGRRHLFEEVGLDRMGDPSLDDPREMRRLLGPSARFAQHAMLLAEQKRAAGATREEALAYLAGLYLRCGDAAYANKALREFGPATGIVDLYPLELVDYLLTHSPSFLAKTSRGSFFVDLPEQLSGVAGQPVTLRYPPELRIRGFAIRGGGSVGYSFEPKDPPGTHHLTVETPGSFELLISALDRDRRWVVQSVVLEIAAPPEPPDGA